MAWIEPAGTSTTSPQETVRQAIRSAIDPSAMALRSCSRRQPPIEPKSNAATGFRGDDVPRLGLAAHFADRPGESVSRMHLDRQRLLRE